MIKFQFIISNANSMMLQKASLGLCLDYMLYVISVMAYKNRVGVETFFFQFHLKNMGKLAQKGCSHKMQKCGICCLIFFFSNCLSTLGSNNYGWWGRLIGNKGIFA